MWYFLPNVPNFCIRAAVFINPLTLRVFYQHHELFSPNFVCLCCIDCLSKVNISKMLFSTLLAFVSSLLYTVCFTFLLTTSLNLDLSSLDIKWPGVCECVCGGGGGGGVECWLRQKDPLLSPSYENLHECGTTWDRSKNTKFMMMSYFKTVIDVNIFMN